MTVQWKPLKAVAALSEDVLPESTPPDFEFEYVDIGNVSSLGEIIGTERLTFRGAPSRARRRVREGDVIVSTVRTYLRAVASIRPSAENLIVSTGFAVLRPWSIDPRFLAYAVRSDAFIQTVIANSQGVSYPAIAPSRLMRLPLPVPSHEEQRAIVRFLDEKTAKIDGLVRRNQRLLDRLDEARRAMVTSAVTKGVRNSPTKDSGVEWIGQMPRHWVVRRVKQVARLASGHTPSRSHPEYWMDTTIPWFQLTDIWKFRDDANEVIYETAENVSKLGIKNSAAELLPEGTVALSRTASVGFSAILGTAMATTQDFANWIPGPQVDSRYLLFVMRAIRPELERLRHGSTHKTVYMSAMGQLVMPLPPIEEQKEIAEYIGAESARFFKTRDRITEMNERLQEYRSALITAAVTGQIDVGSAA